MKKLWNFLSKKISIPISKRKIAIPVFVLIIIFCCCLPFSAALVDASLREAGVLPTLTATFTSTATATLTETAIPSATNTLQLSSTPEPSITPQPPIATLTPIVTLTPVEGAFVTIFVVNKDTEYVDLKNMGNQPQDLAGWRLVSEKGNQSCNLSGVVQPNAILRVWSNNPNGEGFNCNFGNNIWNNSEPDPAVLYNAQGIEVARR